ncbi:hypothetical protein ACLBP9_30845, partial [Klebsiella pneumoniae]|uniref:hypothetical protein n=1 Tax=Klebsiella pneumoniae TaxID=573 RepID=UPI003969A4CD
RNITFGFGQFIIELQENLPLFWFSLSDDPLHEMLEICNQSIELFHGQLITMRFQKYFYLWKNVERDVQLGP